MKSGIVIQFCGGLGTESVPIHANTGVYSEESAQSGGCRFLPRSDWRQLSSIQEAALYRPDPVPFPDAVSIFKLSSVHRSTFLDDTIQAVCAKDSKLAPEDRTKRLWACADKVIDAASAIGIIAQSLRSCDIQITQSQSNSTAFDHSRGHFIGLHIDNHDKLSLTQRRGAFQLLCLNVGLAERYLHFVNLSAPALAAHTMSNRADAEERYSKAWQLTHDFFTKYPDYPVVRVTLPPGYGYIAVTQNAIHDGGTNASGHPDTALLLAGQYTQRGC